MKQKLQGPLQKCKGFLITIVDIYSRLNIYFKYTLLTFSFK